MRQSVAKMTKQITQTDIKPVTVPDFLIAKSQGRKLTVATAYDFPSAKIMDEAGIDCILVGDSLGMVIQGKPDPLSVTLKQMIYHAEMVARATSHSLVVVDLPFMTYQESAQQALKNSGKVLKKTGAHAVKLEGGRRVAETIRAITNADIPVMGHVGLTPQSVRRIGGFKMQRNENEILQDALAVEEAGAFAIVLECIPPDIAQKISSALKIPTIGIGAGPHCDGQVLVGHDLLGLTTGFHPRFSKKYADIADIIKAAITSYCNEVRTGKFPGPEHTFK
jgi:3-methyl-2-oxobutanoate hydroxymethyltransferase